MDIKITEKTLKRLVKNILNEQGVPAPFKPTTINYYKDKNGVVYKLTLIKDEQSLMRFMDYGRTTEERARKIASLMRGGGSVIYDSLRGKKTLANYMVNIGNAYLTGVARHGLRVNESQFKVYGFFTKYMDEETKRFFDEIVLKKQIPELNGLIPALVMLVNQQIEKIS